MELKKKLPAESDVNYPISKDNKDLQSNHSEENKERKSPSENDTDENSDTLGYMNDANSSVDRDTGASTTLGWDAETSRTSRHK